MIYHCVHCNQPILPGESSTRLHGSSPIHIRCQANNTFTLPWEHR